MTAVRDAQRGDPGLAPPEWRVDRDPAAWEALASDWNALSSTSSPLADATWASCLADAFYRRKRKPVEVHSLYADGRLSAVIPLERKSGIRAWVSIDNMHTPYVLFPSRDPGPEQARTIIDHLLSDADYLLFRRLHPDGPICTALLEASRAAGLRTHVAQDDKGDTIMPLQRPWEVFQASVPKRLIQDTLRNLRNLSKQGEVRVEMVTDPCNLDGPLSDCFALEEKGWKGQSGTPMRADPATHRFYTQVARRMSARGRFTLALLRLGQRIIAYEFWLRGSGHIELLKISFDPDFNKSSPGNVLRYLALKHEIESGDATTYHFGRPSPWKLRWTQTVRPLCNLRLYAPTVRGRLAYLAGPVLRTKLRRYQSLKRAWQVFERRFLDD